MRRNEHCPSTRKRATSASGDETAVGLTKLRHRLADFSGADTRSARPETDGSRHSVRRSFRLQVPCGPAIRAMRTCRALPIAHSATEQWRFSALVPGMPGTGFRGILGFGGSAGGGPGAWRCPSGALQPLWARQECSALASPFSAIRSMVCALMTSLAYPSETVWWPGGPPFLRFRPPPLRRISRQTVVRSRPICRAMAGSDSPLFLSAHVRHRSP